MAVMRESFRVCDVCKKRDDVETIRVTAYGKTRKTDLCPEHRRPIDDILTRAGAAPRRALPLSAVPMVSEDELAARRKAAGTPVEPSTAPRSARQRGRDSQGGEGK